VTIPYRVCCSHMVSSPWWWPGAAALAATNNQTSRSNAVSDLLLTGTRPGEKTKGGNTMRKLGFVLVAMLAMTLVGAAYADHSDPIGNKGEVTVHVTIDKWAKLDVGDEDIYINVRQPKLIFGALSELTVATNTNIYLNLKSITPPEGWLDEYDFWVQYGVPTTYPPVDPFEDTDYFNGEAELKGGMWGWLQPSGNVQLNSLPNPSVGPSGATIPVLYAIKAYNDNLPAAGTEFKIEVVYEMTENAYGF